MEEARRVERHAEAIAAGISRESMSHFMTAGMEIVQAANAAMKSMEIPQETRMKLHKAQREFLLAMKSSIEVVIAEIDKEVPARHELRKIEIKKKSSK